MPSLSGSPLRVIVSESLSGLGTSTDTPVSWRISWMVERLGPMTYLCWVLRTSMDTVVVLRFCWIRIVMCKLRSVWILNIKTSLSNEITITSYLLLKTLINNHLQYHVIIIITIKSSSSFSSFICPCHNKQVLHSSFWL